MPMPADLPSRPGLSPLPEVITHEASVRFALMQGSNPTRAEREDLAAWLAADPRHAQAYSALQAQWAASTPAERHPPPVMPYELSRRCVIGLGIAAGALAATAGASSAWLKGIGLPLGDERSAVGERRLLQLPDGSTAELSADTALDLDFSAGKRAVRLLKGEAFFSVKPNAVTDFSVSTAAGAVISQDAEFCVSFDDGLALVTVTRQHVQVLAASQRTDLEQGLSMDFSAMRAGTIQRAELDRVLAWRSGHLVFVDTPLRTVVQALERWREGKIFLMDSQLSARRVSLQLNLNRPDGLLDALANALPVRIKRYTSLVTLIYPA